MQQKNIIFIGGKQIGYNCLNYLIKISLIPNLVIVNPDDTKETWHDSIYELVEKYKINYIKIKKLKSKNIKKLISDLKPEIIFCIGSTQYLPSSIITIPKLGVINIHPALLPKYRGRYSTAHAIFNNEKYTGVTLHWMNSRIDAGPIILQKKIKILSKDTAKTLYDKFTHTGTILFAKFIKKWTSGENIKGKIQNESDATYYKKQLPNDGMIDWSWDGEKIYNFIRAMSFSPFPPIKFYIGKRKMIILEEK